MEQLSTLYAWLPFGTACTLLISFQIKSKGRLDSIVVSHPHYYGSYAEWAKAFDCPVIIAKDDEEWLCRKPRTSDNLIEFLEGPSGTTKEIVQGVTAIKTGGHFPGSLVLHWGNKLFIADTIVTVPVGSSCWYKFGEEDHADKFPVCLQSATSPAGPDNIRLPMVDT